MALMLLTPFAINGSWVITLHSVFAQGIQALDFLSVHIRILWTLDEMCQSDCKSE